MALPDPLKARPSISSEMAILSTLPVNSQCVLRLSMPSVPSNTCTTALLPCTSSTLPCRFSPFASVRFTISANLGSCRSPRASVAAGYRGGFKL